MKTKNFAVALLCVLMLSGIGMTVANAAPFPNLPPTPVTLNQNNLTLWEYPFVSALSDVPVGFDVSNSPPTYVGWCVDLAGHVTRGTDYPVRLYSSLSLTLVAPYNAFDWHRINYILNHKQGSGVDISQAIWYFVNGGSFPVAILAADGYPNTVPTSLAEAMVTDAMNNGASYIPGPGEVVAVICDPTDASVQDTIIELTVKGPGLTPGFWKHNVGVYLTAQQYDDVHVNGAYSDPAGSTIVSKDTMATFLSAWTDAQLYELWLDMNTQGGGAAGAATRNNAANVFNIAAGLATL